MPPPSEREVEHLPTGSLACFPVRYPSGGGMMLYRSRLYRDLRGGVHPTHVIGFENSFLYGRPATAALAATEENPAIPAREATRHNAIDIAGAFGYPVFCTRSARVVTTFRAGTPRRQRPGVGPMPGATGIHGGNYLMLVDESGLYHYYAHMLHPPLVTEGSFLPAGTQIGEVGASGLPQGRPQHLHYQVSRRTDMRVSFVNPYEELKRLAFDVSVQSPMRPMHVFENTGGRVTLSPPSRF